MVAERQNGRAKAGTALLQERCNDRTVSAMEAVEESDREHERMHPSVGAFGKLVIDVQMNTFRGASIVPCISPTPTSAREMSRTKTCVPPTG